MRVGDLERSMKATAKGWSLAFGLYTPHIFFSHKKMKLRDKKPLLGLVPSSVHVTCSWHPLPSFLKLDRIP